MEPRINNQEPKAAVPNRFPWGYSIALYPA